MTTPPYSRFFLLASFDAIVAVGVLLIFLSVDLDLTNGQPGAISWHQQELVYGYIPGILAGFLLTALPRWTGRTPSTASHTILLTAWLVARPAFVLPPAFTPIGVAPLLLLAAFVSVHVIAARNWRNLTVIAVLWMFAVGGLYTTIPREAGITDFGLRLSLGAAIALVMIIAGRIIPSLTERRLLLKGEIWRTQRSPVLEALAAVSGAAGLLAWIVHSDGQPMAFVAALAASIQVLRLVRWRGWAVIDTPSVFFLHVGYGFVPFGFALLSGAIWLPGVVPADAGLHAWTLGAIGLTTLAVMGSMIRRRTGRPFVLSRIGACVLIFAVLASLLRIGAAFFARSDYWLAFAAGAWILAFALFVFDFRRPLLAA